jgi:hypothetical protein
MTTTPGGCARFFGMMLLVPLLLLVTVLRKSR